MMDYLHNSPSSEMPLSYPQALAPSSPSHPYTAGVYVFSVFLGLFCLKTFRSNAIFLVLCVRNNLFSLFVFHKSLQCSVRDFELCGDVVLCSMFNP